jgi:hypothetical protein
MSRREALAIGLADAEQRIALAYTLLAHDAADLALVEWTAFRARVEALLFDLDTATELVTAMIAVSQGPGGEAAKLREQAQRLGDQRVQLHRWLKQIGSR